MSLTEDLQRLEAERDALYALVRSASVPLAQRPEVGEWSVIENLRHLLYAEEKHLMRRLVPRFRWTPLGLPTRGIAMRNGAGTESSDDLDEVLAAWDLTHQRVVAALRSAVPGSIPEKALDGHIRHLRAHARTIRRLLDTPHEG